MEGANPSYFQQVSMDALFPEATLHAMSDVCSDGMNSHSIESQLSNVPSTSETLLYLNEDVFIGRPLSPADISTSLFGPIFRVYPASWIHGVSSAEEAMATLDGNGNARALPNTMRLLDERFGKRDRNYPDHTAYSLTRPIMHEVAQIWQRELKEVGVERVYESIPFPVCTR